MRIYNVLRKTQECPSLKLSERFTGDYVFLHIHLFCARFAVLQI